MNVDQVLLALADPTRRRLLEELGRRPACSATTLAAQVPVSRQAVVKHLAVLRESRLVTGHRAGKEVLFTACPEQLTATASWMTSLAATWEERMQLLKREAEHGTPRLAQPDAKHRLDEGQGWMNNVRFPNESADYRAARDALTQAETDLTRRIEEVAALRRSLPPGGTVSEDYLFTEGPADLAADTPTREVRLSELFGEHDALLLYSFMYGPEMSRPCQMCTSLLDGLDGAAPDVLERAGFAVVAKSPIERLRQFARERGWVNLRLVSSAGGTYNRDYHGEDERGDQVSRMNVFTRDDGIIRHFWATEQSEALPGQDERHVDMIWPLWNLLDQTPAGRGDWRPAFSAKRERAR